MADEQNQTRQPYDGSLAQLNYYQEFLKKDNNSLESERERMRKCVASGFVSAEFAAIYLIRLTIADGLNYTPTSE